MPDEAFWPAAIQIADSRLLPGEPLTQDLMTDYRDRDNWAYNDLYNRIVQEQWLNKSFATTGNLVENNVIDDSIDYRDRYLNVQGEIYCGSAAFVASIMLGGGNDQYINSQAGSRAGGWAAAAGGRNIDKFGESFMYSEDGGATNVTEPYLSYPTPCEWDNAVTLDYWIWVRSTDGALMLSTIVSNWLLQTNIGYHILVKYSGDLGHY